MCERTALCWTLVLLGSCASSQALPNLEETSSTLDTETISLSVFVPTSDDAARPPPVLILLHGARGTGQWMVSV